MTFILMAPYPVVETVTTLPSPEFSEGEGLIDSVQVEKTMDNTVYTYVKRSKFQNKQVRKHKFSFILTRMKMLEVIEFFRAYAGVRWQIIDQDNRMLVGICTTNPIESSMQRGVYGKNDPRGSNDSAQFEFEFEGIQL